MSLNFGFWLSDHAGSENLCISGQSLELYYGASSRLSNVARSGTQERQQCSDACACKRHNLDLSALMSPDLIRPTFVYISCRSAPWSSTAAGSITCFSTAAALESILSDQTTIELGTANYSRLITTSKHNNSLVCSRLCMNKA